MPLSPFSRPSPPPPFPSQFIAELTNYVAHLAIDAAASDRGHHACGCGAALAVGATIAALAVGLCLAPWRGMQAGPPTEDALECPLTELAEAAPSRRAAVGVATLYACASGLAAAAAQRTLPPPTLTHMAAVGLAMTASAAANVGAHALAWSARGVPTAPLLTEWARGRDIGLGAGAAGVLHVGSVWGVGAVCGLCGGGE